MPRKLSISFLGTGGYHPTTYLFEKEPEIKYDTPLVQIAMQSYLQDQHGFGPEDQHLLLLTDEARKQNYDNAKPPHGKEKATHGGLKAEIAAGGYLAPTVPERVLSDHSREGIFKTFKIITEKVLEGDQIYIDITHGFRSLPMLAVVLANFLKVTKKAEVKKIYYGAWEDRSSHGDYAPVYDLSYLIDIQDWSSAAYSYVTYGFIEPLEQLSNRETDPLLRQLKGQHDQAKAIKSLVKNSKELALQLRTNRGNELYRGEVAAKITGGVSALRQEDGEFSEPLTQLLVVISRKPAQFMQNGSLNWLVAARLAFNDNLIQQTVSLLREGIVSYVCQNNNLNQGIENERRLAETALNMKALSVPEDDWKVNPTDKPKVSNIMNSASAIKVAEVFNPLTPLRNDLMHAGYLTEDGKQARQASRIIKDVESLLKEVEKEFNGIQPTTIDKSEF
jgi:CRISPR-associated Csx2 family protein